MRAAKRGNGTQNERSYLIGNRSPGARTVAKVEALTTAENRGLARRKLWLAHGETRDLAWQNPWPRPAVKVVTCVAGIYDS